MTYVILYDGFDTEGWESIQKLFEPSFFDDNIKIYMQSDFARAMEIEDIIDRNIRHTFLFLTVQKPRRKVKSVSLVEKYRYKTLLDEIRAEFPFCEYHQNILCVIDRIPKNIGNGLYMEEEKEMALSLDKFGYLDSNKETYFFTMDDLLHIQSKIYTLIQASEKITKDKFEKEIDDIVRLEVDKKVESLQGKDGTGTCVERMRKMQTTFLEAFWQLELSSFERREKLILHTLKRVFSETIGILGSLNHISILTYRPEQIHEEDSEMHITIASLISLIANRTETVLKQGWFEVAKMETNKDYLGRALKELYSIRLPEIQNEKTTVRIHNVLQLTHPLEPFKEEKIFKPIEDIPWKYSSKGERRIKEKIDQVWDSMHTEIDLLSQNLQLSKDDIYSQVGTKTDIEFTYHEIKEEANKAIITQYQSSDMTREKVEDDLNSVSKDKMRAKFANYFDKLPSLGTYLLSLFVFFMIIFLITLIPEEVWTKVSLGLIDSVILITLFLLSWIPIWYFRQKVIRFLFEYIEKIKNIQINAHKWHDSEIEHFKYSFETKLKYENRIYFRQKLQEVERRKKKWKLHNNRVYELNKIAKDIAISLDLTLDAEEKWLPLSIIEEDISLTKEYALFNQKNKVEEIITDRSKMNYDVSCYGIIKNLEIQRIENGL